MKHLKMVIGVPLLIGTLYGCNNNKASDVPVKAPVEQEKTDTNTNNNVQESTNQTKENLPYNFAEFSLGVDYSATESYEVDYENEKTGVEAELDDDRNNVKLKGDEALTKLEPLFKKLKFDATTANDEVIDQVISVFGIDENYISFELQVKFADGTVKEYNKTK
ncbi:YusW family protein [Viridibacillus sp. YIM B01967]|uniref:YusW family protein n=1 Tax=Viridibacillus soli TaxID=2798301 RepID=A0ABS1H3F0_9BACL|nr:YusW family protein [Viridibacillus soli]MBK3493933.1 YusW family protein [Viridibacillus soli]